MSEIFVRLVEPGFHLWPGAEGERAYLGERHRHLFHVEVRCKVLHDDREIEFHDLQDESRAILRRIGPAGEFCNLSCEKIGRLLGGELAARHQRRFVVTVSEDGECGAVVEVPSP